MSKKIFSGDSSKAFWDAINRSKDKDLLYDYGCKAQEMEASLEVLLNVCKEMVAYWGEEDYGQIWQDILVKAKVAIAKE